MNEKEYKEITTLLKEILKYVVHSYNGTALQVPENITAIDILDKNWSGTTDNTGDRTVLNDIEPIK